MRNRRRPDVHHLPTPPRQCPEAPERARHVCFISHQMHGLPAARQQDIKAECSVLQGIAGSVFAPDGVRRKAVVGGQMHGHESGLGSAWMAIPRLRVRH